jgi:hypothetical protein
VGETLVLFDLTLVILLFLTNLIVGCLPADGAGQAQCEQQLPGQPERVRQHVRRDRDAVEAGGAEPLHLPGGEGLPQGQAHQLSHHSR